MWYFRTVPTVWYFRIVPTVWYFRTVPTVWYFRTVPIVWYFTTHHTDHTIYSLLKRWSQDHISNKGNNKITELRAILQRESQNS